MDTDHYAGIEEDSSCDIPFTHDNCQQDRPNVIIWNSKQAFVDRIFRICNKCNINYEDFDITVIRDKELHNLSQEDFVKMSREHGKSLFDKILATYEGTFSLKKQEITKDLSRLPEHIETFRSSHLITNRIVKRSAGRPRTSNKIRHKSEKKTGKVWEFLLNLLKNPEYDHMISWENRSEGMFRFVSSEKVARLWGDLRGNQQMNYEKLSRAMRYYYKSQILMPVIGKRLVYRFGPKARGWRPNREDDEAEK